MLGMPNAQTDHAQHNPLEGKARQLQSSWGAMLGMSNALWIMRSIILFKVVWVYLRLFIYYRPVLRIR